jgi:hypothetical protein
MTIKTPTSIHKPAWTWEREQVRLPPDTRELLGVYTRLVGVRSKSVVLRTLLTHHLRSVFGRGVDFATAIERIESLDEEARTQLVVGVKESFEELL